MGIDLIEIGFGGDDHASGDKMNTSGERGEDEIVGPGEPEDPDDDDLFELSSSESCFFFLLIEGSGSPTSSGCCSNIFDQKVRHMCI